MGEIKRDPILYVSPEGESWTIFDDSHTLADITRWLMNNRVDAEEVYRMLGEQLNATQS